MARGKSKKSSAELVPAGDPKAPLDGQELLKHAAPVLRELEEDLLERARKSEAMTLALTGRYEEEKQKQRTADPFDVWQRAFVEQVAAAWFLSCVFVRTLEDRGLVERNRLAGPGAADSQRSFFELAPSLTERDYLFTVFRELERFEAARDLFDSHHNPVWLLAPSAEATKALLGLFRMPNAEEPAFRFGGSDTRFLGDLYQDLSENVRKRYALLQTPRFVESYILDRTLEPAIERFGLNETTLMDPTCGSGHFLLGGFERMVEHKLRAEPGLSAREAAAWALGTVYGVDINPYAVAIARFRLTLAFLERAGFGRLREAPRLDVKLAVADSLLENPGRPTLAAVAGQRPEAWFGAEYSLEEPERAKAILGKRHAAVVGNPPYITVKDKAKRDAYRDAYPHSAFREYSLAAPFTECFFQLARRGGCVGMITANSFMKREFGKRLIEDFLRTVNLTTVVNTSGAFIPGHGTPTVLLFGTAEQQQGADVLTVLASHGEPSTPADPEQGLVWRSIAEHGEEVGFENEFVSVVRTERNALGKHPWSLGGGGATELKELLEERAESRLKDVVAEIGNGAKTREDEVYILGSDVLRRWRVPPAFRCHSIVGEVVRDWAIGSDDEALWPYDAVSLEPSDNETIRRLLWPWRTQLQERVAFGKRQVERGLPWTAYSMFFSHRFRTPLTITFAFVATHNHFVLTRGVKVFHGSAPIIKLPESATEDDHLALLAYLNSSTACFWMKQECHNKTNASQKHTTDPARASHEFAGTALQGLPCFLPDSSVLPAVRELLELGSERAQWLSGAAFRGGDCPAMRSPAELQLFLTEGWARHDAITARAAYLQEELDWYFYEAARLLEPGEADVRWVSGGSGPLGSRAFEAEAGYDPGVSAAAQRTARAQVAAKSPDHWVTRVPLCRKEHLTILESRAFKRMWRDIERNIDQQEFRELVPREWVADYVANRVEHAVRSCGNPQTTRAITGAMHSAELQTAGEFFGRTAREVVAHTLAENSVPFLSAFVFTETGLEKHADWQLTWDRQRREDQGNDVGTISVPPEYSQGSRGKSTDFRDPTFWRLRGKLDVPKERFISYPGCESDEDGEPVYGWAGWDHLQRAQALAALYQDRKEREGWDKKRLVSMLAGLLELIPWIKQWHNEPSEEYGGLRLGEYFESYLKGECVELGLTEDDLRGWRPDPKGRGAKKSVAPKPDAPKKPARKRKAKGDEAT
jgi:hypothetical protein